MNIIQPWQIQIFRANLLEFIPTFDLALFAEEVFTLNQLAGGQAKTQDLLDHDLFPHILHTRDHTIRNVLHRWVRDTFDFELKEDMYDVETNAKWIPEGEGLYPHVHASSAFSVIVYPQDSESALVFFDPRVNACRGYPAAIRDKFFAKHAISPKAGDMYIFPSYLQHSVSYVKEDVRLSLLHEYYLHNTR
jgi:hypothetical protein